jgi:hypothetical protein
VADAIVAGQALPDLETEGGLAAELADVQSRAAGHRGGDDDNARGLHQSSKAAMLRGAALLCGYM